MQPLQFEYNEAPGLVSIVIPTRNGRRFLDETLAGIASQSYVGWELIIVEDGSRDGSREVIEAFARENPHHRVEYLRNDSSCGAAYSRNRGIMAARGEYVALLDCDDYWLPSHLKVCVESLEASDNEIVYSTVVMFADSDGIPIGLWGPTTGEIHAFPHSLFNRNFVTPSASVWRRSTMGEVGAWDAKYHCCEDTDYAMRAAMAGKKFHHLPGVHCMYRKEHEGATTQKLADTIEEQALIAENHLDSPNIHRKSASRAVANTNKVAADFHLTRSKEIDPSANPARASHLYYKAWRLHKRRWKYLLKSFFCRIRYGGNPGIQPIERPSMPIAVSHQSGYERRAA